MRVVIGGYGRVGRYLAHVLESEGHEVSVIDHSPTVFAEFGDEIQGRKINGEVYDRESLIRAGIRKADAFAACTADDNVNIVAARVARERFGVKTVVARIYEPRNAALYSRFDITTISSVRWAARKMVTLITHPNIHTERIWGGGEIVTVRVSPGEVLGGKSVAEAEAESGGALRIGVMVRNGIASMPTPDTVLLPSDRLYITAMRNAVDELTDRLGQEEMSEQEDEQ